MTIKEAHYGDGEQSIHAEGDLIATGALVSTPNGTYFYPDINLKNLFYNADKVLECARNNFVDSYEKNLHIDPKSCNKIKPSENTPMKVYGDVIAKTFGATIYGAQGVRVKIHINRYIYSSHAMGGDSGVTTKNIVALTPPKKLYDTYPTKNIITKEFGYASKDDYVNIRNAPKGAIVGQIQKADIQKKQSRGIIIGANCEEAEYYENEDDAIECRSTNGWYEVFYLPPGVRNGKDAIYGYIHKSQLKLK